MREIKFRAWDDKEYHYFDFSNIYGYEGEASGVFCRKDGFAINYNSGYNDESELNSGIKVIEQYTGLKDKNGKEIYEGDIVKYYSDDYEIVFYDGLYFMKDVKYTWDEFLKKSVNTYPECMDFLMQSSTDFFEIIGNIHETSELLEKA